MQNHVCHHLDVKANALGQPWVRCVCTEKRDGVDSKAGGLHILMLFTAYYRCQDHETVPTFFLNLSLGPDGWTRLGTDDRAYKRRAYSEIFTKTYSDGGVSEHVKLFEC